MPVEKDQSAPVDDLDAALESLASTRDSWGDQGDSSESNVEESTEEQETENTDNNQTESEENSEEDEAAASDKAKADSDESESSSSDEEPKLTRRQRAKLYEQFKAQAEKDRAENEELRERVKQAEEADKKRSELITKALGSNEEYQKALQDMQSDDPKISDPAKKRFKIFTANRDFYGELQAGAEREINTRLAKDYWSAANERPGIDTTKLDTMPMKEVLLHYYDVGAANAEAAAEEKLAAKDKTIETLRGQLKEASQKKVADSKAPVKAGKSVTSEATSLNLVLGDDGLPTDEAITAGRNGRLGFLKMR